MPADAARLSLDEVLDLSYRMLRASGASHLQAEPTAWSIRDAEADGLATLGLSYVLVYCDHLACGKVVGDAVPRIDRPRLATVVVDAGLGFSHPAFVAAEAELAVAARECGVAVLLLQHSYSAGALSWFVERVADAGLVGLMFSNCSPLMAPAGGRRPFFGTNPFAWAAPRSSGPPVVADLSSSAAAWVTVDAAAREGRAIPLGWAIDAAGEPTTDAAAALGGAMLPAAGHKGSALALLVDLVCGAVAGGSFSFEASGFVDNRGGPPDVGQVILAIDAMPAGGSTMAERIEVELTALAGEPGVRLPGARRLEARARTANDGVAVDAEVLERCRSYAEHGSPAVPEP